MHPTVLNMLFGEHTDAALEYDVPIEAFCQLGTPKRHALAASVTTARSQRQKLEVSKACKLLASKGDGISLRSLLHPGASDIPYSVFKRISDQALWSPKDYRQILKLSKCPKAHAILRHSREINRSDIAILNVLSEQWRKPNILGALEDIQQAQALMCLGEAVRFVAGEERERAFVEAVSVSQDLGAIEDRFWRVLYRNQTSPEAPLEKTSSFERIKSEKQCRRLAKVGHCFDELCMMESVFTSESLFYLWTGAKDAVVELLRDSGPFGWYIGETCRPRSKALSRAEMKALTSDLSQLAAPVSLHQWTHKIQRAFLALEG